MSYVILDINGEFLSHYPDLEKPDFDTASAYLAELWGTTPELLLETNSNLVLRVASLH